MPRIVFDIETAGKEFDSLDPPVQDYLLRWAESEEDKREIRESLSFYPVTGEIVSIGMFDPDKGSGTILYQNNSDPLLPFEEEGFRFECGTEREILERFWGIIRACHQFITFNGRAFDCPFLIIRSAINGVKPSRDLMPNRYGDTHIDLLDQLTFYGATRRRFSLDMWCRAFGIKSPKADGITGYEVTDLYRAGRHLDIARYCAGDLKATAELLRVWEHFIRTPNKAKSF